MKPKAQMDPLKVNRGDPIRRGMAAKLGPGTGVSELKKGKMGYPIFGYGGEALLD